MSFKNPALDFHPFSNLDNGPVFKNASNIETDDAIPWVFDENPIIKSPTLKLSLDTILTKLFFGSQSSIVPIAEFEAAVSPIR